MDSFKLIIVDDSAIFREGLRFFLEKILSYTVLSEASDGSEFLQLKNKHLADVILMDIHMPVLNGIDAMMKDKNNYLLKTIAITGFDDPIYLNQLIEAGFKGYINKNNVYKEIKTAIENVANGHLYFPPGAIKI